MSSSFDLAKMFLQDSDVAESKGSDEKDPQLSPSYILEYILETKRNILILMMH